jgi:uncharacterized OB-fold protein
VNSGKTCRSNAAEAALGAEAVLAAGAGEAPFVFAAVALDEGVLMYSRIECNPSDTDGLIGRRVGVVFRDLAATQKAPYFQLVD